MYHPQHKVDRFRIISELFDYWLKYIQREPRQRNANGTQVVYLDLSFAKLILKNIILQKNELYGDP